MNKEVKKVLKELNETLDKLIMGNEMKEKLEKEANTPVKILIEKGEDGVAKTTVEGTRLGVLITLAGLEKSILEEFEIPNGVWELIKRSTGVMEV